MSDVISIELVRNPNPAAGLTSRESAVQIGAGDLTKGTDVRRRMGALGLFLNEKHLAVFDPLFTTEVVGWSKRGTVETAVQDLEKHVRKLKAAFDAGDVAKLDDIASRYQAEHAFRSLDCFDPVARALHEVLDSNDRSFSEADLAAFQARFSQEDFAQHAASAPFNMLRLQGQLVSAVIQKNLGKQPVPVTSAIKSLAAASVLVAQLAAGREAQSRAVAEAQSQGKYIPKAPIKHIIDVGLTLPRWIWQIDPCKLTRRPVDLLTEIRDASALRPAHEAIQNYEDADEAAAVDNDVAAQARVVAEAVGKDVSQVQTQDCECGAAGGDGGACDCSCGAVPCRPTDPCCAPINYYVTETLVLRDKTVKYVASDVAHIENVMALEKRERAHTFIKQTEDYTETEQTVTTTEERNQHSTERFNVQKQIESQFSAKLDVRAEYNTGKTYKLNVDANVSYSTAQKEAREEFREAVNEAISKIQLEERTKTTRRVLTESKEQNTHGFEPSEAHNVGKYFHVSKVSEGQVYGHGKRLTIELMIASPWALYEHLEHEKMMRGFVPPCVPDVVTPQMIEEDTYQEYSTKFCVGDLPEPPKLRPSYSESYAFGKGNAPYITVPPGYYGANITIIDHSLSDDKNNQQCILVIVLPGVENVWVTYKSDEFQDGKSVLSKPMYLTTSMSVQFSETNLDGYQGRIRIDWVSLPVDMGAWQQQVADLINTANRKDILSKAKAEYVAAYKEGLADRHPFALKEIMLAEIKRASIYMMCENFERDSVMNMNAQPCGYPEIIRPKAGQEAWDWYFWERCFDWGLMSFVFYDYFWNDKCRWPDKFSPDHPNFLFNAFCRAGLARVMIPVSPGMEEDALWYIKTKEKWGPKQDYPRDPSDPRWVHVIDELKRQRDCYQNDREGKAVGILDAAGDKTNQILISGTDRYWNAMAAPAKQDASAINDDVGRQIWIDGVAYEIQDIAQSAPGNTQDWIVTLDRPFEGEADLDQAGHVFPRHNYAVGAKIVGAPFRWEEPTNLVWLGDNFGDHKHCLPTYPVEC